MVVVYAVVTAHKLPELLIKRPELKIGDFDKIPHESQSANTMITAASSIASESNRRLAQDNVFLAALERKQ